MSNLGLYQIMTTISKKVGGPANFMLLLTAGGYGAGKGIECIFKKAYNKFLYTKSKREQKIYSVVKKSYYKNLLFDLGDKFKVLESDGDAILVEKIDDPNNPYYVPNDYLRSISDFN